MTNNITVYFDGSCLGNPGPGGYGVIIFDDGEKKILSGGEAETTNNKMELTSAIKALEYIHQHSSHQKITMIGDSNYVRLGITEYIHKRINNGRKLANKKPVLNQDLRKQLYALTKHISIERKRVKGHSTDIHNNEVDEVARTEAEKIKKNTKVGNTTGQKSSPHSQQKKLFE